jgi:hypothetical protein
LRPAELVPGRPLDLFWLRQDRDPDLEGALPQAARPCKSPAVAALKPLESPDGKTLHFAKSYDALGVMSMPVEGGIDSRAVESARTSHWAVTDKGIWFLDFEARPGTAPCR